MNNSVKIGGLTVAESLYALIHADILPDTGIDEDAFWSGFADLIHDLSPINHALLKQRDEIQAKLDAWHQQHPELPIDLEQYKAFLKDIDYLVPEGDDFHISTENVDAEIAQIAGPQLVVPVNNARFALNAANARWGSLYDALYGTDAIAEDQGCERDQGFNVLRAKRVILRSAAFLDQAVPLTHGSHVQVQQYALVKQGTGTLLQITLNDNSTASLQNNAQFIGYQDTDRTQCILLKSHDLHIELHIDATHHIGKHSLAGVKDIILESALSTIQDCEDSVAAVDAEDKVLVYRNWLGLMKGDLQISFDKNGQQCTRRLNPDRYYTTPNGEDLSLHGRSLLLVRNVGHLMCNAAIIDQNGNEIPEGILDAVVTSLCALHDLNAKNNSRAGSIYIVKPKMHGPEEAAFTNTLFNRVEDLLGLARYTLKVGVMDEERRTTVNLKECIRAVKNRLFFINTGFLDRTGDEIHTSMHAGAVLPKDEIKAQPWISAYENWNVEIGLACGLTGKAQIGKGMWAMPDEMARMLSEKQAHPLAGANCAWVPSPTVATL
ncbi:MAG: malate synthase G, partial [Arenicellales bacterium]